MMQYSCRQTLKPWAMYNFDELPSWCNFVQSDLREHDHESTVRLEYAN